MKRTLKGAISGVLLAVIAIAAIALIALGFGIGLGFGGGIGDGEGSGNAAAESSAMTAPPETTVPAITTAQLDYLIVTISENDYLFGAQTYTSDELETLISALAAMREAENIPVKVTDDNASQRAYSNLKTALKEHSIPFIDGTDAE